MQKTKAFLPFVSVVAFVFELFYESEELKFELR